MGECHDHGHSELRIAPRRWLQSDAPVGPDGAFTFIVPVATSVCGSVTPERGSARGGKQSAFLALPQRDAGRLIVSVQLNIATRRRSVFTCSQICSCSSRCSSSSGVDTDSCRYACRSRKAEEKSLR